MVVNILSFISLAILFVASPITALSLESSVHVARHHEIARNIRQSPETLAKRSTGRCKPRPTTSPVVSSVHISSTPPPAPPQTSTPAPAAPSPSPSPAPPANQGNTGGGKGGVAWALGNDPALKNFVTARISSVYTWSVYKPSDLFGLEFTPMLWGADKVAEFKQMVVPGYARSLIGFNEPDLGGQSNINPWYAAQIWQDNVQPLRNSGYNTMVSPCVSSAPDGITWLKNFLGACTGCTFDAVCAHWYGTNADEFINYVTNFHNTFNKPVWVTEFACFDFTTNTSPNAGEISNFMKTVTGWMDNTAFVHKYFAFGVMPNMQGGVSDLSRLMNPDGSPTSLGWDYIQ